MSEADRLRLAARVQADFNGFGYAPLLADDMRAIAGVGLDVANALTTGAADVLAADADRVQTGIDRAAAAGSATTAGALLPTAIDRTVGRRVGDSSIWTMVRATPAWGFNSLGSLEEVAADTLRWEFEPTTLAPLGAAFAPGRTNSVTNPRAEGAVAGTPGTIPTGWNNIADGVNGISRQIIGTGSVNGLPYIDVQFTCSSTPAGAGFITLANLSGSPGQVYSVSAWVQLVSGTPPSSLRWVVVTGAANQQGPTFTLNSTLTRRAATVTLPTGTTLCRPSFSTDVLYTGTFTLRFALPQLELGPFASSPILPPVSAPAASTRAQGTIDIPVRLLGTRYNRRAGTIILDWNSQPGPFTSANDTDWMGLVSLGDLGANDVMGLLINPAHTSIEFRRIVGGSAQTAASQTITAPAAGETIRCAFAWDIDAGLMQVAARGAVGTQLTGQTSIPVITHLMPGRFSTTRPLAGRIAGLEIRPAAVFGSPLAALT